MIGGDRRTKVVLMMGGLVSGIVLAAALFDDRGDPHAYQGIYRNSEDPALGVELIPDVNEFINADGFFGRDYAREKPDGTWRIVGLGDSVTMYYSAERLSYLSLLEGSLPSIAERDVEVLNLAVASYETPQQVRTLEVRGLPYDPDFVVVGYCVNDGTDFVRLAESIGGRARAITGRWADDNVAVHERIRDTVLASGSLDWEGLFREHISRDRKWLESTSSFVDLRAIAEREGLSVLVVLFPALLELDDYYLAPVHRALGSELEQLGFSVLDLAPVFRDAGPVEALRTNERDSLHPSALGHRVAWEAIQRWMIEHRPWERGGR